MHHGLTVLNAHGERHQIRLDTVLRSITKSRACVQTDVIQSRICSRSLQIVHCHTASDQLDVDCKLRK
jgi:hypothetical protein